MICDWVPKLDLYVDGELSADKLKEVQAHLQACPKNHRVTKSTQGRR